MAAIRHMVDAVAWYGIVSQRVVKIYVRMVTGVLW